MNTAQLRDDVIDRLEIAKEHIRETVVFTDDLDANGHAMLALKEIGFALDTLHDELQKRLNGSRTSETRSAGDDDGPSVGDVAEAEPSDVRATESAEAEAKGIRALAGAMQQRRHGGTS